MFLPKGRKSKIKLLKFMSLSSGDQELQKLQQPYEKLEEFSRVIQLEDKLASHGKECPNYPGRYLCFPDLILTSAEGVRNLIQYRPPLD